jgi:putative spermidine/putrescine transport system ATP-binding protein
MASEGVEVKVLGNRAKADWRAPLPAERAGASVRLSGLRRSFGPTKALNGLSLDIAPGELVALLGPSGCGKTTALRVLAGFETLDAGHVLVDGQDLAGTPAQKRDMGMVFQSYSLFPNMDAVDNVAFGLRMRGHAARARRDKAGELLDLVGLAVEAKKFPHQMSGGQQQRVALARALAIEPRVLLLDEPLSALDAKVRLQLRQQIRSLQQRLQTTTVFVTHDQEEALSIADRVCVMRDGRIEQVDAPADLYARPATPFVAEFVGTMNRIPGVTESGGVRVLGRLLAMRGEGTTNPGVPVDVLVRPEALSLSDAPGSDGRGIVTNKTFLGAVTRVQVLVEDGLGVQVDQPSEEVATLALGAPVGVFIAAPDVLTAERRAPAAFHEAPSN